MNPQKVAVALSPNPMAKRAYLTVDDQPSEAAQAAIPDEAVLQAARERPELFGLLVDRYSAPFLRLAQRVVRERTEAEDVVQEAFVKIYRYANRFQNGNDRKFSSWAYKIVLNTAITHYHKVRKREWLLPDPAESGRDPTAGEAHVRFKEAILERETGEVVRSVLAVLPEDLRGLLQAYYLEDKSYHTIAGENGITLGALKMKLFRARKLFRKFLVP